MTQKLEPAKVSTAPVVLSTDGSPAVISNFWSFTKAIGYFNETGTELVKKVELENGRPSNVIDYTENGHTVFVMDKKSKPKCAMIYNHDNKIQRTVELDKDYYFNGCEMIYGEDGKETSTNQWKRGVLMS